LFQLASIHSINKVDNTARIKWDVSRKIDVVHISDLKPYSMDDVSTRKRKVTDFFVGDGNAVTNSNKKIKGNQKSESKIGSGMEMKYYSLENQSKFCAEGAIKNFLHVINMSERDITSFWNLSISPLKIISETLNCEIPKSVCNTFQQINSIQKCLWILREKFRFTTTKKLKLSHFTSAKKCIQIFGKFQFPLIVAVHSRGAVYDHVIVIWEGKVYDYESKYVYELCEEVLQNMCGENTAFRSISTGYGLFPPSDLKALSPNVLEWGDRSYFGNNSKIRRYFSH